MNDELIMANYLLVLKSTVEVYVHGTIESSNNSVRMTLKDNLNGILSSQAKTYDKMMECGWYPINNVATNTITETLNKVMNNN